jgi:hypothetical protein
MQLFLWVVLGLFVLPAVISGIIAALVPRAGPLRTLAIVFGAAYLILVFALNVPGSVLMLLTLATISSAIHYLVYGVAGAAARYVRARRKEHS